jgi:hypothetical protein
LQPQMCRIEPADFESPFLPRSCRFPTEADDANRERLTTLAQDFLSDHPEVWRNARPLRYPK